MGKLDDEFDSCDTCGETLTDDNGPVGCKAIECQANGCETCMPKGYCEDHGPEHAEPQELDE
jgi:hypothetical protein